MKKENMVNNVKVFMPVASVNNYMELTLILIFWIATVDLFPRICWR